MKGQLSSGETAESNTKVHDIQEETNIMPFETNLLPFGSNGCSQKYMDSQMSTTADMTNTMASFTMTTTVAIPKTNGIHVETDCTDLILESQKKLEESVRNAEKNPDFKLWEDRTGSVCYPGLIGDRPVIVFENAEQYFTPRKSEKIIEERNFNEDQVKDKELNYHLYPEDFESLSNYTYWGYYTQYIDFLSAVRFLIVKRNTDFTSKGGENLYFSMLYSSYMTTLLNEKHSSRFYASQAADLDSIVNHWKDWKISSSSYPRIPRCSRQYIEISDYQPAVVICSSRDSTVRDLIRSPKSVCWTR